MRIGKLKSVLNKKLHRILLCIIVSVISITLVAILHFTEHTPTPVLPADTATFTPPKPKLAIIIDDFGQNRDGVKEMMSIKRPLTFAIMPFLDFTKKDALQAHQEGYEVITHLPMQSTNKDMDSWLGPKPIKVFYSEDVISEIVFNSINSVPYSVGANIHMGAKSSEDERVMTIVMNIVKEMGCYFVDSRTSGKTVCRTVAKETGVNFLERNVFLENPYKTEESIKKQLESAGDYAIKHGQAVVIGHVGSVGGKITAKCIQEMIPVLEEKGIQFEFVSELLE